MATTVASMVRDAIARLRLKLLDLTNRNRLLNFKFSETSRKFVRVVDELPDALYARLTVNDAAGGRLYFAALPEPPIEMLRSLTAANQQLELTATKDVPIGGPASDSTKAVPLKSSWSRNRQPDPHTRINVIDWAKQNGINPSFELPKPGLSPTIGKHIDNQIQTMLFASSLEKKLGALREDAGIAQQETGVKTLYAAFGFLEWFESDDSEEVRYSPLFLLPVEIDRELKQNRYRYFIESVDEGEPVANVSLQERLKRDFGISLPQVELEDTPESYLDRVGRALQSQKRWQVRRFVVIGHFSFSRLVMYQDLAPESWQAHALEENPLLSTLLAGAAAAPCDSYATEYEVDDHEIESNVPVLITDADSSQFSAIVDAMKGRSFAIQGPPGTGKSQTITNLIAAALAAGKKVLFVAEKQAALQVVSKRLCEVGLEPFLLELHSTKIQKKRVLNGFEERLKIRKFRIEDKLERSLIALREIRSQLKFYVGIMNCEIGQSGITLHDAYWQEQRTRRALASNELVISSKFNVSATQEITPHLHADIRSHLERLAGSFKVVASAKRGISAHPMFGLNTLDVAATSIFECRSRLHIWEKALVRLDRAIARSKEIIGCSFPATTIEIHKICDAISGISEISPLAQTERLAELVDPHQFRLFVDFATLVKRVVNDHVSLAELFENIEAVLPNAEKLSHHANRLWPALQQSGLSDQAFSQLPNVLKEHEERLNELTATIRILEQFVSAAQLNLILKSTTVGYLLNAVQLLHETQGHVLSARSEILYNSDVRPILERAKAASAALKIESEEASYEASLTFNEDPVRLREAAAVLRDTSPILRLFSSKFKAARKIYQALSKGPFPGAPTASANLARFADLIERRRSFESQSDIRALAGTNFDGISTPFETLIGVVEYWDAVRKRWRTLDADARQIQKTLLFADKALLEDLSSSVSSNDLEMLEQAAKIYSGHPERSISENLNSSRQALEVAKDAAAELVAVRYRQEINASAVADQFAQLASLRQCRSTVRESIFASMVEELGSPSVNDVRRLEATTNTCKEILLSEIPQALKHRLMSRKLPVYLGAAREFAKLVLGGLNACVQARESLVETNRLEAIQWFRGIDPEQVNVAAQLDRLREALSTSDQATMEWSVFRSLANELEQRGLGPFVGALVEGEVLATALPAFYDLVYLRSLIEYTVGRHPNLNRWTGEHVESLRKRLVQLDREYMKLSHGSVVARLSCADVPAGVSQGAAGAFTERSLIERETAKQRKHISIRDLIRRSTGASRALKPCFMMSPSSVAQFLPAGREMFDLVIIDEASQMRPEDALGAIARGKQAIVVGDPMQLPPTTFFDTVHDEEELKEDEDLDVDTESVLDLAISSFRPHRELRWHYRSQHHSLIAFSNREFYRDNLIVFPSPKERPRDLGVQMLFVEKGIYQSSVNVLEADAVTDAVASLMWECPGSSIGVVAVNQPQKELLTERFDKLFADEPDLESYRNKWASTLEEFFVKNLENVQGDERDIIVISTVYGPSAPGVPPHQRFGPINSKAGHRRLNVLFTRAKQRVLVVTSLKPEHIRTEGIPNRGAAVLKGYLEYARSGRLDAGIATGGSFDSPFEAEVADVLNQLGFRAEPQVGVAGYFIDLGVRHPQMSDHFILGIECDGASYHSAKSARDRDRLRQVVLENLGWKLYRIWSTDWFHAREREVRRLELYLRSLTN